MQQHRTFARSYWGAHHEEMDLMMRFLTDVGQRLEAIPVAERHWWFDDATDWADTTGDQETWAEFVDAVSRSFPRDGMISELASVKPEGSRLWTIPPIDGTWQYITGYPLWAIGIALVIEGEPVASAISFPTTHTLYMASREREHAYRNGEPIETSARPRGFVSSGGWSDARCSATLGDTLSLGLLDASPGTLSEALCPITTLSRGRAVIDGGQDGTIYQGDSLYCVAPLVPIINALGMIVTDLEGRPQRYDRPINGAVIARTEDLHARLMTRWREFAESLPDSLKSAHLTPATAQFLEPQRITTFSALRLRGAAELRKSGFTERAIAEIRNKLAVRGHRMRN
jgi:fructose-1,6-bisphosphatase/inositol monophosphatase family enzyme